MSEDHKTISLSPSGQTILLRPLKTQEDYKACVALQEETWGKGFSELVPTAILLVGQKLGGVTAGAFNQQEEMIGFVFGLTGLKDGRLTHWSDMLAVRNDARNLGLGRILKLYQREVLLPLGVEEIYWTFDPLVSRNAHLNLNKLGAEISEYVEEMYPSDTGSELHRGIGMDRIIITWKIRSERVRDALEEKARGIPTLAEDAPVVNSFFEYLVGSAPSGAPESKWIRIEIPSDIHRVKSASLESAQRWRKPTRQAFLHYLARGYKLETFIRDPLSDRSCYLLVKDSL
jgi:predicted GNAT superfamily acetyltransferase